MTIETEQDVVDSLSIWLSRWGFEIYQNHKNDKYKCFSVSGESRRKPDLYIREIGGVGFGDCVIEVKKGDYGMGEVIDGAKIVDYYSNYCKNKTKYYITDTGDELKPTNFLLATKYSMNGRLFRDDLVEEPISPDGWRPTGIKYGMLPKKEYIKTYTFIRTIYSIWKKKGKTPGTNLGVLLSDVLDGGGGQPAVQGQIKRLNAWRQRWYVIGCDHEKNWF